MKKALLRILLVVAVIIGVCGCQTVSFYGQAIKGQYQILAHQEPIQEKIASPDTPADLKAKLTEVIALREFAAKELRLPTNKHYLKYVDLHRPYAVWTVSAAPELSLEPKTWWFPIVGSVSYRGYFSEDAANKYAKKLKAKGLDVDVGGVTTYSTLGWFNDPLLNTFVQGPESELVDTIFHELTHQRLYIAGDTDFNEALATTVAEEGVYRWYKAQNKPEAWKKYQTERDQHQQFIKIVLARVEELRAVYNNPSLSDEQKRVRKQEIISALRADHEKLKIQWGGKSRYDEWFKSRINNAVLGSVATYYDLVPDFQAVLRAQGGDMEKFFETVKKISKLDKEQRREALKKYRQAG